MSARPNNFSKLRSFLIFTKVSNLTTFSLALLLVAVKTLAFTPTKYNKKDL